MSTGWHIYGSRTPAGAPDVVMLARDGGLPIRPEHTDALRDLLAGGEVERLRTRCGRLEAEADRSLADWQAAWAQRNEARDRFSDLATRVGVNVQALRDLVWHGDMGDAARSVLADVLDEIDRIRDAAFAPAEPAQDAHGGPTAAPGRDGDAHASTGTGGPLNAPQRPSGGAATVAPPGNGPAAGRSATLSGPQHAHAQIPAGGAQGRSEAVLAVPGSPDAESRSTDSPGDRTGHPCAEPTPGELLTPDQWCAKYGIRIHDPDGWRGRNGRPFTDRITLAEFQHRATRCTADQGGDGWERMAEDLRALTRAEAGT